MSVAVGDAVRFGILGTGAAAHAFARGLSYARGARLFAVGSRAPASARAFAAAHGGAAAYGSYQELVADRNVDVVYVATPGARHRQDALLCLGAGKPVLCEKPFTLDATEAAEVVAAARDHGLFCMEAMWMRFLPLVQRARTLIGEGALGEVRAFVGDFALATHARSQDDGLALAQGALLNRGVYLLSLARYLLGGGEAVASTATLTGAGVDTHSAYLLRFGRAATASCWASLTAEGSNEVVVIGERGRLRLHEPFYRPHRLSLTKSRAAGGDAGGPEGGGLASRLKQSRLVQHAFRRLQPLLRRADLDLLEPIHGNGYSYEAEEVVRCLRGGRLESDVMPLDETLAVMRLLDRVRTLFTTRGAGS